MTTPITIADVLACVYISQAAAGLRPGAGPAGGRDEILEPLVKAGRPVAAMDDFAAYVSRGPVTGVRLAAAVVLTTRVLCRRPGAPKPGPVRFSLDRDAPDHDAFALVAGSEFGEPSSRSGGGDRNLELVYGGTGERTCHVHVAGPRSGGDAAQAAGSGLSLCFSAGDGTAEDLREGGPAERGVPDPVARQRPVPLVLDLLLGRRRFAPAVTRVVCGLEAADPATDERLTHTMNLLTGK